MATHRGPLWLLGLALCALGGSPGPRPPHSCPQRRLGARERRDMQREILAVLGLPGRPRPRAPPAAARLPASAPLFMLDLYHSMAGDDDEDGGSPERHLGRADLVMSFVNMVERDRTLGHQEPHWKEFRFDLTQIPAGEAVTAAEFRIYKLPRLRPPLRHQPSVRRLVLRGRGGDGEGHPQLGDDAGGWGVRALQEPREPNGRAAEDRREGPEVVSSNVGVDDFGLGLFLATKQIRSVVCSHLGKNRLASWPSASTPTDYHKLVQEGGQHQVLPHGSLAIPNQPGEGGLGLGEGVDSVGNVIFKESARTFNVPKCKAADVTVVEVEEIVDLYVSFQDLGWLDWVIAPRGYSAYYCEGECSFPLDSCMNATNHAILQSLVHLMKPDAVPKACCAPTKLSATSVLYYDSSNNVILRKHRNMVVKACGCH
ncbi:bone morphogenetic protein 8b [Ictidomys tridecemlineatus]|uniref:bone morphogenetic protein 8B n=1 Tax=Ictidomys tridecemlineatus TaxID=43179 RepID=UPI00068010A0|nr:bone morphogenetic protein 8B [Ictidomys tridecemlineatus]KAG3282848.1 bone morphogenetic protein 8b [Ictidomys tridecemlineatus]